MKKIAIVILLLLTLCLCGCERNEGEIMENDPFYSLQKIYNDKLLTRDELRKINRIFHSCIIEEMIGGFSFTYVCNQKIIVWKKTK